MPLLSQAKNAQIMVVHLEKRGICCTYKGGDLVDKVGKLRYT